VSITERKSAIDDVLALREKLKADGARVPDVIVVDARKVPSASKR